MSDEARVKIKEKFQTKLQGEDSQRPGIKHWTRKQSGIGLEGRGLSLESLRLYRKLLHVWGQFRQRGVGQTRNPVSTC